MWQDLPKDIGLYLFGFFDIKTILRGARVCSRWRKLADTDLLWKKKLEEISDYRSSEMLAKNSVRRVMELASLDFFSKENFTNDMCRLILSTDMLAKKLDADSLYEMASTNPDIIAFILDNPKLIKLISDSTYLTNFAKLSLHAAQIILTNETLFRIINPALLPDIVDDPERITLLLVIPNLASTINEHILRDLHLKYENVINRWLEEYADSLTLTSKDFLCLENAGYIFSENRQAFHKK